MNKNSANSDVMSEALLTTLILAGLATSISLVLSGITGWMWGHSLQEKMILSAVGMVAVLGAHLLLAICRKTTPVLRMAAIFLWCCCITYAVYSHASFFLHAQQQAGIHRVEVAGQSAVSNIDSAHRARSTILAEREKVYNDLIALSLSGCRSNCYRQNARETRLSARMEVLAAELVEQERWQTGWDREQALKEAAREDLVVSRLADWIGIEPSLVGLIFGILFAFILEGVACVCWLIAATLCSIKNKSFGSSALTFSPIMPSKEYVTPQVDKVTSQESDELNQIVNDALNGTFKVTVTSVRERLRCGQKHAADQAKVIRRRIAAA